MKGGLKIFNHPSCKLWGTCFPEILVIEPPSNLAVSTWQASREKSPKGGGVSSL